MSSFVAALALSSALPLFAQDAPVITEARVRELVSWLADDARLGRDTPSPGLEATAKWIEERFTAAGLVPPGQDGYRHRYELPGQRLDSRDLEVTIEWQLEDKKDHAVLHGDSDIRLLRPAASAAGRDDEAAIVGVDDPRLERLLGVGGGRRATLLEIDPEQPLWISCGGVREFLSRRMRGSAPVFLVRKGALAAAAFDEKATTAASWKGAGGEATSVELCNLVGILRGSKLPDEYVIVSAHYDHIGIGAPVGGDSIRNGADDDATGTTAVLMLAEAFAKRARPARSIAFVLFSAEEKGLRGSAAFAERPPLPLGAVVANCNIEMIGRPEPGHERKVWITGRDLSDFAAIAEPALRRGGCELIDFALASDLFAGSDNLSLARKGVVAHSISAGGLIEERRLHSDYHQPSDEVEKLDIAHMTAVIGGVLELVVEFADREGRPRYTDKGLEYVKSLDRR